MADVVKDGIAAANKALEEENMHKLSEEVRYLQENTLPINSKFLSLILQSSLVVQKKLLYKHDTSRYSLPRVFTQVSMNSDKQSIHLLVSFVYSHTNVDIFLIKLLQ